MACFAMYQRQSKALPNHWSSVLWADASGYYAYLPFVFIYNADASAIPINAADSVGNGFSVDSQAKKFKDKYTCGVALMQLPFFICVNASQILSGIENISGFEPAFYWVIYLAALFYGVLGFFFLYNFLSKFYEVRICMVIVLSVFLGTPVYYYLADSSGMSHIYSFFLISAFLLLTTKVLEGYSIKWLIIWAFVLGLILLIRPTNLLLVFAILAYIIGLMGKGLKGLKVWFKFSSVLVVITVIFLIWLPQLAYWHYLTGIWWHYSYGNESFSNLTKPKVLHFLFAPENGLLIYTPWILFAVSGSFITLRLGRYNFIIPVILGLAVYLYASWHQYYFGCGFGSRNFVEYTPLLALPAAGLLNYLRLRNIFYRVVTYFFLVLVCWVNLSLTRNYGKCFGGNFHWDWDQYRYYLLSNPNRMTIDFEKTVTSGVDQLQAHSGKHSVLIADSTKFAIVHDFVIGSQSLGGYRHAELTAWFKADGVIKNIDVLLRVDNETEPLSTTQITFPGNLLPANQWVRLSAKVNISRPTPAGARMKLIFTGSSCSYRVDDVQLVLR